MGRLGDRFVLVRELGPGGMSRVFLGRDEVLDRPVAVKIVEPDPEDPEVGLRFQREGRAAARLSHPNIVRVYDAGEDELDGHRVSYIVMEYVPGGDFEELMDRNGPLPETMLSRIGADVASGLAHAHERGIIHRDIKAAQRAPRRAGEPQAGRLRHSPRPRRHDEPQPRRLVPGTAAYSSPEQLRGERVTPKSDVYSLGATLYHAAVGEQPFSGNSIEVANQHILQGARASQGEGGADRRGLEALILDCLAKRAPPSAPTPPGCARGCSRTVRPGARAGSAAAEPGPARFPGAAGISRLTGGGEGRPGLQAAGSSDGGQARQRPASGPPERTISLPTRTFRAGSRQRTTLAAVVIALSSCFWPAREPGRCSDGMPGGRHPGQGRRPPGTGQGRGTAAEDGEEPAKGAGGAAQNPSEGSGSSGGAQEENPAPPRCREGGAEPSTTCTTRCLSTGWTPRGHASPSGCRTR